MLKKKKKLHFSIEHDFQNRLLCPNISNENSFSQTFRAAVNETTIW